jgi:hypothetical protein
MWQVDRVQQQLPAQFVLDSAWWAPDSVCSQVLVSATWPQAWHGDWDGFNHAMTDADSEQMKRSLAASSRSICLS